MTDGGQRFRVFCLIVAMLALRNAAAHAQADRGNSTAEGLSAAAAIEQTFTSVIDQAEESIVGIARVRTPRNSKFRERLNPLDIELQPPLELERSRPESPDFIPNEFGTGIIIAPEQGKYERLILTNYHVVKGGPVEGEPPDNESELYVRFANRRGCRARILAADPRSDLAVLKVSESDLAVDLKQLEPIKLGDGGSLRKGQLVVALGNPYAIARDGSASASWGMISNIGRRPAPLGPPTAALDETIHHFGTLLQVDTRLNLGTSGGALLNLRGELIGVTTSLAALEGYEQSVGYAIPVDGAMRRVIDALSQGFEVEYGFLGVEPADVTRDELRRRFSANELDQPTAARAETVFPNSPASLAGMQQGDLILEIDKKPIYDRYDLMLHVGRAAPEAETKIRVWRENLNHDLTLTVQLGKWPVRNEEEIIATVARYPSWRGLRVDFPTGRYKYFPIPYQIPQAVLVTSVEPRSSASAAELQAGDFISTVNGTPVDTPGEFEQAVRRAEGDATLQLADGRRVVVRP